MSTNPTSSQVDDGSETSAADGSAAPASDHSKFTSKLRELLAAIVSQNEGSENITAEDVAPDADFAQLGINSVDFLEFVTAIEREFDVDVPDELLSERKLISIEDWARYLSQGA